MRHKLIGCSIVGCFIVQTSPVAGYLELNLMDLS